MAQLLTEGTYMPPYPLSARIANEIEILGLAVSAHPLTLYPDIIMNPSVTPAAEAESRTGQRIKVAGMLVTSRRVPVKDSYMKFMTLEDPSGIVEAVLFPMVYREFGAMLKTRGPYVVTGTMRSRVPGETNLIVEKIDTIHAEISVASQHFTDRREPLDIGYSYYS